MYQAFSVIIPTFNRADKISKAIDSLISQSHTLWEAIIVDNNSSDRTEEVVKSYRDSRIKFFKINNNGIIAKSRNYGISKSKYDLIAFLDSDDWWTEDKLKKSLEHINNGASVTYHDMLMVNPQRVLNLRIARTRQLKKDSFKDLINNGQAINNSSVVLRKDIISKAGLLSERKELSGIEDFDLWLRLSKLNVRFKRLRGIYGSILVNSGDNFTSHESMIRCIDEIKREYSESFQKYPQHYWAYYIKGRALYKLEKYEEANVLFKKVKIRSNNYLISMKSLFMIFLLKNKLKSK